MKTYKYSSAGRRPVLAQCPRDAAEIFALRFARERFGRRATVRTLHCNCHSVDGTVHEYESFVGLRTDPHTVTGRAVYFTVTFRGEAEGGR